MTEYKVNPIDWYSDRKLTYTPKHFTITNTPICTDSELWLRNTFTGRYSITSNPQANESNGFLFTFNEYAAFEDPKEAMMYELKWS